MKRTRNAFTLVEMLIVIAIISILAAMAITSFSNAAQDSREVLVRQQLATFQEAVNNWSARQIGKTISSGGVNKTLTVVEVLGFYNDPRSFADPPVTISGSCMAERRFKLFEEYLGDEVRSGGTNALQIDAGNGRITTNAMRQTSYYLTLPDWGAGSYPKVQLAKIP